MRPLGATREAAQPGAVGRRAGYLIAVVVNVVFLWLVTGWPGWRIVPFLTEETENVIPLVVSLLLAGVVVNLVNFALDMAWLKALGEIITGVIAIAVLMRFWEVFPFDFGVSDIDWALVARVVIAVAIFGCAVSIVVQIVVLVRAAFRGTWGSTPEPDRQAPAAAAKPPSERESKDVRNRRL